jgi:outer membrane protein assembly factor BamB
MHRPIGVFLILVALCFTGCAPPGGEFAGLVQPEMLAKADLQYYWHVRLQLDRGEEIARLYLVGERLYCLTDHNRLLALDAARGVWLWSQVLARPQQKVFAPVHADKVSIPARLRFQPSRGEQAGPAKPFDAVILNTLSEIPVLDRSTGELVTRIPFDFPASTGGAVDAAVNAGGQTGPVEHYFLASSRGWYYGISLLSGLQEWGMSTGGFISASPVFYNGIVYVAGEDNVLYAVKAGRYAVALWNSRDLTSQQMHGPVTASIYVDGRGCFVPCQDNRLYAFDRLTGRPLWEPFVCQQPLQDPIQVGDNTIFQLARRDGFYAIDIANGQKRWSMPEGEMVLATMKDRTSRVYLLDSGKNLRVVEEMTGKVHVILPMTGLERFLPNATVPAIYAATRKGRIVCLRPSSAGYLMPEAFEHRPY